MGPTKLYSSNQVKFGSFWGGPVAMVYFLHSNFVALGQPTATRQGLIWGVVFNITLLAVLPFLPDRFPHVVIPVAYSVMAGYIVDTWQLKNDAIGTSELYCFQSTWRVFGLGTAFLIAYFAVAAGLLLGLDALGIIHIQ
jgi:hypothetical protein